MLIYLSCGNFFSFADEAEVSFQVGKKPPKSGFDYHLNDNQRLNKVIGIIGANGSGKTNLIKPLGFLRWFIGDSFGRPDPDEPLPWTAHVLRQHEPSELELAFVCNAIEYRYELSLVEGEVKREALYQKTSRAFSYIFIRTNMPETGEMQFKQKGFGLKTTSGLKHLRNISVLSFAKQFELPLAIQLIEYFKGWAGNLRFSGRQHFERKQLTQAAKFYAKYPEFLKQVSEVLSDFDLGISDIDIREIETFDENNKLVVKPIPIALHSDAEESFELPLVKESSGTQSAFVLLTKLFPVLSRGGVAFIDEIDNDLHPHMLSRILDWFRHPNINDKHAQLIFSCHTPEVLNLLMKHQVYLVEKQNQFSETWRLDDVEGLRTDDNLYAKYMAGALSAVPDFD